MTTLQVFFFVERHTIPAMYRFDPTPYESPCDHVAVQVILQRRTLFVNDNDLYDTIWAYDTIVCI